eukprot:356274-Chlamydomonas_euryale.AAC.13
MQSARDGRAELCGRPPALPDGALHGRLPRDVHVDRIGGRGRPGRRHVPAGADAQPRGGEACACVLRR